jgi:hypothetical protein
MPVSRTAKAEDILPSWLYAMGYAQAVLRERLGLVGKPDTTNPQEMEILNRACEVALAVIGRIKY